MSTVDLLARYALRPMEEAHFDEVVAIERVSYTNPWVVDAFRHEVEQNAFSRPRVAMTVEQPHTVVGYCVPWLVFDEVHIQNLAVHPRHRGCGLARHLLRRALEDGLDAGAHSAQLEVRASNAMALKLYASLGFRVAGERRGYYSRPREDAVLLHKELR
ncbi:MAG: ribosomal protein S18-alanine N-acetyltransferase [Acidobacteriota bacterium]|nr:MAG: ribosomal protein S18-alanine N-acetyltransferase [Acidobacteriota bacterium]